MHVFMMKVSAFGAADVSPRSQTFVKKVSTHLASRIHLERGL
jgi:hypothetical protein